MGSPLTLCPFQHSIYIWSRNNILNIESQRLGRNSLIYSRCECWFLYVPNSQSENLQTILEKVVQTLRKNSVENNFGNPVRNLISIITWLEAYFRKTLPWKFFYIEGVQNRQTMQITLELLLESHLKKRSLVDRGGYQVNGINCGTWWLQEMVKAG